MKRCLKLCKAIQQLYSQACLRMKDTLCRGCEFVTGVAPDSLLPWTDSCAVWERYPGFRNSTALKLQLQVMRSQLEGAW